MNAFRLTRYPFSIVLVACVLFALLLGACQPAVVSPGRPPEQATATSIPEQPPVATPTPVAVAQPSTGASGEVTLELAGVAQDQTVETIAAVPAGADGPLWDVLPQLHPQPGATGRADPVAGSELSGVDP